LRGKNRLRMQKLNVAIYDQNMQKQVIRDVILSDQEEVTEVACDFAGPYKAIVVNDGDYAFCKVSYDEQSVDCFQEELYKVDDVLERCVIWRQLWIMVLDGKVSSVKYCDIVAKQLKHESIEQIFTNVLESLDHLV